MKAKAWKLVTAILWGLLIFLAGKAPACDGAVNVGNPKLQKELPVIIRAAERNKCRGDDLLILFAIRLAENGRPGREFGVLHPRCLEQIEKTPERSLDIQAGWAAATIVRNRARWLRAGCRADFIDFLADRYCPREVDAQGNRNFKRNVKFWFKRFRDG